MIDALDASTVPANQVMVVGVPVQLVLYTPVPQIGQIDETELGQQVERAVDGGFVEIRVPSPHARENFLRREMPVACRNHGEHTFTLRCQAVARLTERLYQLDLLRQCCI